ncbi:uncharacterized protein [Henckelia pumila]|uniref:uncharacterized protein n=1 Tax=Henckelia pumila TaxID=405737 RepID=UPI003C6E4890
MVTFGQNDVWRIFVDGASSIEGSGVGVILVSPTQEKIKVAVKLDFQASNNEADYEAVVAGMKQAREVGVSHVMIYSNSQLVVQQVKKTLCTREEKLMKYLKVIEELGAGFLTWSIEQIPREENIEADALAKKATAGGNEDDREVQVQRELVASIEALEPVSREDTWMAPIVKYLTNGDLLADKRRARVMRRQAPHFSLLGGMLYKRSYQGPLLICLMEGETEYVLREVHEGCYGNHGGSMSLARRVLLSGYWWPTLQARLYGMGKDWVEEIPSVLWAYRTTPHTATQESSFSLVYGSEAILPVEIGQPSARVMAYESTEERARAQELDLIEELKEKAAQRMEVYRARVTRAYNRKVKPWEFQERESVLKMVNPAGEVGKLDAQWEGPYKLIRRVGINTWYLEDDQGRSLKRPWNAVHLKKYFA